MSSKDGLKDFLYEHREFGFERRIKRMREDYLYGYKERFIELLVFFIATKDEFPKSFEELEGLANEENKEGVAVAKEAFGGDLAEALCSIKGEVPVCLLDEFAAILIKFKRCLFLNDAKQDWYKQKNIKLPKSFDVKKKEYAALYTNTILINLDEYKAGKTLINEYRGKVSTTHD